MKKHKFLCYSFFFCFNKFLVGVSSTCLLLFFLFFPFLFCVWSQADTPSFVGQHGTRVNIFSLLLLQLFPAPLPPTAKRGRRVQSSELISFGILWDKGRNCLFLLPSPFPSALKVGENSSSFELCLGAKLAL